MIKKLNSQKPKLAPDESDDLIWDQITQDIKKIDKPKKDLSKPIKSDFVIRNNVNVFEAYSGNTLEEIRIGQVDNIDYNTVKRFKKGEFRIEAILDLHGKVSDQAYEEVERFIKRVYQRQLRCVQIITGKGLHRESDDLFASKGVLKDLVPRWLNSDNIRPLILAFDYSRPEDGGEGALSILMRRKR